MIVIKHSGSFKKTDKFLKQMSKKNYNHIYEKYAKEGVLALASVTPVASGLTADSWGYEIRSSKSAVTICWTNDNVVNGVPIAIILQYGHATRNGGYVEGVDYINPAIRPIFDRIADEVWKEVTTS